MVLFPWSTYTSPEIAHVGLYEKEAKEKGIGVDTFTQQLDRVDRAILDGETESFMRVHVRKGTDEILGATVVAAHAGDLIGELTLAMTGQLGLKTISATIHPYPTQAEAIRKTGALTTNWSQWPGLNRRPTVYETVTDRIEQTCEKSIITNVFKGLIAVHNFSVTSRCDSILTRLVSEIVGKNFGFRVNRCAVLRFRESLQPQSFGWTNCPPQVAPSCASGKAASSCDLLLSFFVMPTEARVGSTSSVLAPVDLFLFW